MKSCFQVVANGKKIIIAVYFMELECGGKEALNQVLLTPTRPIDNADKAFFNILLGDSMPFLITLFSCMI